MLSNKPTPVFAKTVLRHTRNVYRDSLSKKKVYMPNPNKVKLNIPKPAPVPPWFEVKIGPRINDLGIQMIPKNVHRHLFPHYKPKTIDPIVLEECRLELLKHKMETKPADYVKEIDLKLPPLEGRDIEEHFRNLGEQQSRPYKDIVYGILKKLPEAPTEWVLREGWTRYIKGSEPQQVDFPLEQGLIFDVEVCMGAGRGPTLATAVSDKAWYGWISPTLITPASKPLPPNYFSPNQLIPFESTPTETGHALTTHQRKSKLVIGHNVSFDRCRIKEQYWLERTGTRFLDTMSLHICVSGLTSYQRAVLKSGKIEEMEGEDWSTQGSLNSLDEVHKLYCGAPLAKETRQLFINGTMQEIKENFQEAINYCAEDVKATWRVLQKVFPLFEERFPHPVTLAGMLELGTAYLPVNENWQRYLEEADRTYEDMDVERQMLLMRRAEGACQLLHNERYKEDLWLWDQDWTTKSLKLNKTPNKRKIEEEEPLDPLDKKFRYLEEMRDLLPKKGSHLLGYPNWYRKLCTKPDSSPDWVPLPHLISTSMQITPKLLNLTWEGYPLHFIRGKGWGFLVPFNDDIETDRQIPLSRLLQKCPIMNLGVKRKGDLGDITDLVEKNLIHFKKKKSESQQFYKGSGVWCSTILEDCCFFLQLPHKDGLGKNVGNPLSKDFLSKFSENILAGDTESATRVLSIARALSYWRNSRDRIKQQMVVWLDKAEDKESGRRVQGAILPQVVVCGTLTRRAVEPTWMTASNIDGERVGSELRAMVQVPEGYRMVGADVDSQELWIASMIGDAHQAELHGATPFGWMTLSGSKANGTDMHSVTANAVGISRDHAKVINYARIYGAGQPFAERLLKQYNPAMEESQAKAKAAKMFALTKGKRLFYLKREYLSDFPDQKYTKFEALQLARSFGKRIDEMFNQGKWLGGTESSMFNRLEEIAGGDKPETPFLQGRLSRALETRDERFLPTKVNWVVQSGAVDFLHLMLVSMRWLCGSKARFCLSFHDEVRYIVKEEDRYRAALAMHVTNLMTRSFCASKVGIQDLPMSVAFFSSVEVDWVLRKDANKDCKTPSNPHGLEKGYEVGHGEELDIYTALEKAGGRDEAWFVQLQGGA